MSTKPGNSGNAYVSRRLAPEEERYRERAVYQLTILRKFARASGRSAVPCDESERRALYSQPHQPKYDDLEKRLAAAPVISIPTITLEGDANGAPHPDPAAYRNTFSGKYAYRLITGGIGHNLPQEAPQAFAEAIFEVAEG